MKLYKGEGACAPPTGVLFYTQARSKKTLEKQSSTLDIR